MTDEEAERIKGKNDALLRAYKVCFGSPAGQMVLADLSSYCKMAETTYVIGDPHTSVLFEGRRQVFLQIAKFVKLTEDEILQLRLGRINLRVGEQE